MTDEYTCQRRDDYDRPYCTQCGDVYSDHESSGHGTICHDCNSANVAPNVLKFNCGYTQSEDILVYARRLVEARDKGYVRMFDRHADEKLAQALLDAHAKLASLKCLAEDHAEVIVIESSTHVPFKPRMVNATDVLAVLDGSVSY